MDSFIKKLKFKIFTCFTIKLMYRITTRFCIKLRKLPMTDNNERTDLLAQPLWDKIEDEWVSEDEDNDWVSEKVVWVSEGDDDYWFDSTGSISSTRLLRLTGLVFMETW